MHVYLGQDTKIQSMNYWAKVMSYVKEILNQIDWRGHSTTEAVVTSFRASRIFTHLSETEYSGISQDQCSCGWQDTVIFSSYKD